MKTIQGQQVGNYRLTRLLGQGGFADVFLGDHIYLHTQAALKVVRVHLSDEHSQRFLTEARIIAHLDHPHIVKVHDFGVHDGIPFLVMSYAPHGSVRALHTPGKPLPVEQIIKYSMSMAEALQHAHQHGVVHRDVKPENMLLGSRNELLLSDFGIAVFSHSKRQQRSRDIAGTVAYMAPEQLQGYPCPASDQYALGIVIYEWLCGVLPFNGSCTGIAVQHVMASPPSLCKQHPGITPRVEKVVLKALAKDSRERFPSVLDFVEALTGALLAQQSDQACYSPAEETASGKEAASIGRPQQRPLIGRKQECTILRQALLAAERYISTPATTTDYANVSSWVTPARPTLMVLSGDVGIGKTRLAEECSRDANQRGWSILWGRAYAQDAAPYQLWTDILRQAMKQNLWFDAKKDALPSIYQPLTVLLPELSLLSVPQPAELAIHADMAALKLWDAVLAVLTDISKQGPILIVLDDIQWADQSSCDLLSYLCRHLVDYPVVVLGTCRETGFSSLYPFRAQVMQLQRELLVRVLHLNALTDSQIAQLVVPVDDSAIVQRIQQLASGNPFFAEELARTVNMPDAVTSGEVDKLKIPLTKTITALFDQRLEKLTPPCLQLLRAGAILGGSFSLSAIMEMLQLAGKVLDEEDALTLLEEALQSGLLTEQGGGHDINFHFWHPLFTQHIYESIFAARRSLLHKRASQVLQHEYARREEEGAALIVHHLLQGGGEARQIVYYANLAGHRAYTLFAYAEAERYYRLAIQHMEICLNNSLNSSLEQQQLLAEMQEYLAECLRVQGYFKESCKIYTHILEQHQLQLPPSSDAEKEQDVQIQALLLGYIGRANYDQGHIEQAHIFYERGELLLKSAGITSGTVLAHLYFQRSYAYWIEGIYEPAQYFATQACKLLNDVLDEQQSTCELKNPLHTSPLQRTMYGHAIELADVYSIQSGIASANGQYVDALHHLRASLDTYEQFDYKRKMAITNCNIGDIHLKRAEYKLAIEVLKKAMIQAQSIKELPLITFISCNLGLVSIRCGNVVGAEIEIRQALQLLDRFDDTLARVFVYAYLSVSLAEQGRLTDAQQTLCVSLNLVRHLRLPPYLGPVLIALSYVRLMQFKTLDHGMTGATIFEQEKRRLLKRSRHTLERVLQMSGIEAETRYEGQVALLEVLLLSGEYEETLTRALQMRQDIERIGVVWLSPRLERIIGCCLGFLGWYEQSYIHLQHSIDQAKSYEMSLEYARSLQSYACILLRQSSVDPENHSLSIQKLRDARAIFAREGAQIDLQCVDYVLTHISERTLP